MSPATIGGRPGNKIRHIVRIRQMLQSWRRKARVTAAAAARSPPSDVPAGHVAVSVGSGCRRFIVRATYLNHPMFQKLLAQAEEEYGFAAGDGPLSLPCDEDCFEEVLRFVSRSESVSGSLSARFCHVDIIKRLEKLAAAESRPLLREISDHSVC